MNAPMPTSQTMALDFSAEDWDRAVPFADGCWVIANRHCPALNRAVELNNRIFAFRLVEPDGSPVLLILGCADEKSIQAVQRLQVETGLDVKWVVGNGGAHHLFLELWYEAFPNARVLVPAKRIPFTRNGRRLQEKYADRWELMHGPKPAQLVEAFGDQLDVVIFDQLFSYSDETSAACYHGEACDHRSKRLDMGGFSLMKAMGKAMKDQSQPNDEVTFFHRATGLVVGGHNFQFVYAPKGFRPEPRHKLKAGGFPMNLMMKMMMPAGKFVSAMESMPCPIADPAVHAAEWEAVLEWDIRAWTTAHNPVTVVGPPLSGRELKAAIRASLARTGEDDPSGARLKIKR